MILMFDMLINVSGQFSDSYEEESRPKACVGICYYNKLMALEAKEDLASHNLVYKDQVGDHRVSVSGSTLVIVQKEEPCDSQNSACNEMEEDIIFNPEQQQEEGEQKSSDNNVIVIDEDDQTSGRKKSLSDGGDLGTIYIDDNNEDNSVENPSIDIRQQG